jgi:acyl carrier protein
MVIENKKEEVIHFLRKKIAELTENPQLEHQADDYGQIKEMGMDSVKTINMIVQIEQHFDIMFEDEELIIEYFSTIDVFANSILDKLGIQA